MTPRSVKQQTGFECGGRVRGSEAASDSHEQSLTQPRPESRPLIGRSQPFCIPQTVEEEWRTALLFLLLINSLWCCYLVAIHAISPPPLSFSCFPRSPWWQHPSHHCRGDRRQVPGGAGGGGWFDHAWARGPDGSIGGHRGCGAQPGAHAAVCECARPACGVAGLLLGLRRPAALPAPLQEVCEHLTFALHADLAAANKVVVVCDETINVLCHLEKKHWSMRFCRCLSWYFIDQSIPHILKYAAWIFFRLFLVIISQL